MKTLRILYHLARADFLERTRRYSFLVTLGLVVWLGYASASGQITMRIYPDLTGGLNSAWVGTLMALTVTFFLGLFGFYLVKGSVARDYDTGVGQIMATTPLGRPIYMLGKWLSNFLILGVMILILMVAGVAMNLLNGTPLDPGALLAPLLYLALPGMAFVAALAVLFDSIPWLRSGLGNVVYFFAYLILVTVASNLPYNIPLLDITGFRLVADSVRDAALAAFPDCSGQFTFSIFASAQGFTFFPFSGIPWTTSVVVWRAVIFLAGIALAGLSAVFFDRFNPSRLLPASKQTARKTTQMVADVLPGFLSRLRLPALPASWRRSRFAILYSAEVKMLLKGQRWWWVAIAAGLVVAQLVTPLDVSRKLLVAAWIWLILILGGVGNRESRNNTSQIVFSAPRPVQTQLPAAWLAAFSVVAAAGSGAFFHFLLAGELYSLLTWLVGAAFIPSLALVLGVLTGSSKTFEVIFILWGYSLLQRVQPLDFMGITLDSPWYVYLPLAMGLVALAMLARQRQLHGR